MRRADSFSEININIIYDFIFVYKLINALPTPDRASYTAAAMTTNNCVVIYSIYSQILYSTFARYRISLEYWLHMLNFRKPSSKKLTLFFPRRNSPLLFHHFHLPRHVFHFLAWDAWQPMPALLTFHTETSSRPPFGALTSHLWAWPVFECVLRSFSNKEGAVWPQVKHMEKHDLWGTGGNYMHMNTSIHNYTETRLHVNAYDTETYTLVFQRPWKCCFFVYSQKLIQHSFSVN